MQIDVSVKNPTRGGCSAYPALPATSSSRPDRLCSLVLIGVHFPCGAAAGRHQVRPGLDGDPSPPAIALDVRQQLLAARPPPGPDVAGDDLALLDEDVGVGDHADQVVDDVTVDHPDR